MASIIKVDTIQDQDGNNIINENADVITVGASGDTITIPAGATLANAGTVTGIPASAIDSGTIATARLGTGTASSSTFLRGDQTYAAAGLNGWSEDGANNNLLPASASAGIYLGVNTATASNLLNDYEEGTWSPVFSFNGGGSVGYSAGFPKGTYRKIGKTVHIQFSLAVNSASSPSGETSITGLPFTASGTTNSTSSAYLGITRSLGSTHNNLRAYINENSTVIQLPVNSTSSSFSGLPGSDVQNTTLIFGNATYFTD